MQIGILAVQGAFIEHKYMLDKLGVKSFEIRQKNDLNKMMDGLILPGGESTAMHRLINDLDLFNDIKRLILAGLPVFGTCAGMILLAKNIENQETHHLGVMNITVKRNAYGRQLGSFTTQDYFNKKKIPMTFIRAPYVLSVGEGVQVLSVVDEKIVAVREKNMLATAFHPELTNSTCIHEYFIQMINHGL
jgi:5'-phosphate synthase pdxT subunit